MAGKRDSSYFKARLKRDYPKIHSDLVAGRYKSVRAAAIAAGMVTSPTRLDALKREWKRASLAEKKAFLAWARPHPSPSGSPVPLPAITDSRGYLLVTVVDFLVRWTKGRKIRPGQIMKEMGFSNYDYRLAHALRRQDPLAQEVCDKLPPWLVKAGFR
jgi:hypothetical protein